MVEKWKQLTSSEKAMVGMIIILLLMVLLNWNKVTEGVKSGYNPVKKEMPTNNKNQNE